MTKVAITGPSGFVARNLISYLKSKGEYDIVELSLRNDDWKKNDFSDIDAIVHLAGISSAKKDVSFDIYKSINVDLTRILAQKAKEHNIFFIFVSSMGVMFDRSPSLRKNYILDLKTECNPTSNYPKSKYEAELLLRNMADEKFKVAVVRPPIIYGEGCSGNYNLLRKIALKLPFFPDLKNRKSMIYVGNLCELFRLIIDSRADGLFLPQNRELVETKDLVAKIAKCNGKKIYFSKLMAAAVKIFAPFVAKIAKAFGNLYYTEKDSNAFDGAYQIYDFNTSVELTEKQRF